MKFIHRPKAAYTLPLLLHCNMHTYLLDCEHVMVEMSKIISTTSWSAPRGTQQLIQLVQLLYKLFDRHNYVIHYFPGNETTFSDQHSFFFK